MNRRIKGTLPDGWIDALPGNPADLKPIATRAHSSEVLNSVANVLPELIGGSADLSGSNLTFLKVIATT